MTRPRVVLAWRMGADGRIAPGAGRGVSPGSPADRARLRTLRQAACAIVVGARTIALDDYPLVVPLPPDVAAARAARGAPPAPLVVVASGRGRVPPAAQVLARQPRAIVAVTEAAPAEHRARLLAVADVWVAGVATIDWPLVLARLANERGVREVLGEGGALLNASLLAAGVVDELYVTVSPALDGGDGPGPIGTGFTPGSARALTLVESQVEDGELFVRYRLA